MKLLNSIHEDYHMHSLNFSDGYNTIDEIVSFAWKIGLKKIAITDHSQAVLDVENLAKKCWARSHRRRKNMYNDIEVIFGIEWDLLNESGDCCFEIEWASRDYLLLSCHEDVYIANWGNVDKMTEWYLNAIERFHDKIKFIGHLCKKWSVEFIDVEKIVKAANKYWIPLEFNSGYLRRDGTDLEKLDIMLMDENAQISAEMILLMGAMLVLVIVAGGFILNISSQIANSIGTVLDTARNSTINRM